MKNALRTLGIYVFIVFAVVVVVPVMELVHLCIRIKNGIFRRNNREA